MASSRLMEFVPHTVCRVLARRKFKYFVVPLRVFWEAPERVICLNEDVVKKAMILRNKMVIIYGELSKNPPFPNWESGLDDIWE